VGGAPQQTGLAHGTDIIIPAVDRRPVVWEWTWGDNMRAKSRYKQVQITLTEELDPAHRGSVRITMRVLVKPLEDQWHQRHTVLSVTEGNCTPLSDLDAVYGVLMELLSQPPLPVSAG
jgi:hypothetical protein